MKAFHSAENSMEFRSGEYTNLTPALMHICSICSEWWNDALSITRTDFCSGHFPQCWRSCSMESSKTVASIELKKKKKKKNTRESTIYPEHRQARSNIAGHNEIQAFCRDWCRFVVLSCWCFSSPWNWSELPSVRALLFPVMSRINLIWIFNM